MDEKIIATAKSLTQELLTLAGVEQLEMEVLPEIDVLAINIQTPDSALLIGRWGETLASIQLLVGLMLYKATGSWQTVKINVNGWREQRDEYLKNLALNLAQKVKFSGVAHALPPLSSQERRLIHLLLDKNADVYTESEGEGDQRRLIIKPHPRREPAG